MYSIIRRCINLLCLMAVSCSTGDWSSSENAVRVNIEDYSPVTDFFDSYKFVVLETSDSSLISHESIFRTSDRYIVSYSAISGFTIFSKEDGKYLNSFNHFGEGPEEYVQLTDYFIKNDAIFAVSGFFKKILEYSIIDGKCLNVHPMDGEYVYASPLNDGTIVLGAAYNSSTFHNFAIYDPISDTTLEMFSPYHNRTSFTLSGFNSFVGTDSSGVYSVLPYNNSLYHITSDTCEIITVYDFNTPYKLPHTTSEDLVVYDTWESTRFEKMVQRLLGFYKMPSDECYQVFEVMSEYGYIPMICKYNSGKTNSKTLRLNVEIFDEFPFLYGCPFELQNEYYISALRSDIAMNTADKYGLDLFSDYDLTADSNPVIFFHHLKK